MRKCYSKKGILALSNLIGIILSTIALVLLVTAFQELLFLQHPNDKIIEQTSTSVSDFISFSQENNYEGVGNCYTTFRIEHITSYQAGSDDNENNYFFVITPHYIGSVSFEHLDKFKDLEEGALNFVENKKEFNDRIEIKLDNTEEGSAFLNELTFTLGFAADTQLSFSDEKFEYILLVPTFDNQQRYNVIFPYKSIDRNMQGFNEKINNELLGKASYLAFSPQTNELFIPKHGLSESFVEKNSCLRKKTEADLIKSISPDEMYKLDYINYRIVFEITPRTQYSFEWNQGPVCKEEGNKISCEEIMEKENPIYKEFIQSIQSYIRDLDGDISFGLSQYIPLYEYYSQDGIYDVLIKSEDILLDSYFNIGEDCDDNDISCYNIKEEFQLNYYNRDCWDIVFWCDNKEHFIYSNNKIFYYAPFISDSNFVYFDEDHIRAFQMTNGEYIYQFNNIPLEIKEEELANTQGEITIFSFSFTIQDEEYKGYLSQGQLKEIQSKAPDGTRTFSTSSHYTLDNYFKSTYTRSENNLYSLKEEYNDEYFLYKNPSNMGPLRRPGMVLFKENENIYFYENHINSTNFVSFNEENINVIDPQTASVEYYYFSEKVEMEEVQLYNHNGESIDIAFYFELPFEDIDSIPISESFAKIYISKEQMDRINGGEQ